MHSKRGSYQHRDAMICTDSNVIAQCDVIMDVHSNVITHCNATMEHPL